MATRPAGPEELWGDGSPWIADQLGLSIASIAFDIVSIAVGKRQKIKLNANKTRDIFFLRFLEVLFNLILLRANREKSD